MNLLVATSVLEEGIDVPQCNLVVRFDFPAEFRSYVQSRGRARSKKAEYVLMSDVREAGRYKEDIRLYYAIEEVSQVNKQAGFEIHILSYFYFSFDL